MHAYLRQSTASQGRAVGPFVDDTDFKTAETGLTIANTDVKLSKNGAASVNKNSGGGIHIANGMYGLTFNATDTDTVGELSGSILVSGALVVTFKFFVLEEAVYDEAFGASAAGFAASVWDADATNHQTTGTFGKAIGDPVASTKTLFDGIVGDADGVSIAADIVEIKARNHPTVLATGTAQGGTASTIQLASSSSFANDELNNAIVKIISGTGAGQHRLIHDYTGATDTADIRPDWTTTPNNTSVYEVVEGSANIESWRGDQPNSLSSGLVEADMEALNGNGGVPAILEIVFSNYDSDQNIASSTSGTVVFDGASMSSVDNFYKGMVAYVYSGTGAGQARRVWDYVGSTKTASIYPDWGTNPDTTSDVVILPSGSELQRVIEDNKLDHLVAVADSDDPVNDSIIAKLAASDGDWSGYDNTTDSQEAIRDRGDAAWLTGGGGGLTQAIQPIFAVPPAIDLANTASVRIGIILTNSVDDLPTAAEITPGTISIWRKAQGGTTWTSVVAAAAMSEQDGMVYYDEVFDSTTGYADGDMIRFQFESVSVTADSNTYNITGATGVYMYSHIVEDMRGTDGANTTTPPTAVAIRTEIDSNSTQLAAIVADTNELQTDDVPGLIAALNDLDAAAIRAALGLAAANLDTQLSTIDTAVDGIQTDLSNGTDGLGALKTLIDAVQADLDNGTDGLGALLTAINALNNPTVAAIADAVLDEALAGHTTIGTVGERLGRIPNAAAGGAGGLPTVDASNQVAGIQGTKNTLDDLNDFNEATDPVELLDSGGTAGTSAAELVTDILDEAIAEPSGIFSWPASLRNIVAWLGVLSRNKMTATSTTLSVRNDADLADLATSALSDNGTTAERGEMT